MLAIVLSHFLPVGIESETYCGPRTHSGQSWYLNLGLSVSKSILVFMQYNYILESYLNSLSISLVVMIVMSVAQKGLTKSCCSR